MSSSRRGSRRDSLPESRRDYEGPGPSALQAVRERLQPEWDRRGQSKRSLMAVALPATLAILFVSVALGGACLYWQKQLQSLPRARQSPSDWLEESGAKNQGRLRILSSKPDRLDMHVECRPGSDGALKGKPCSPPIHTHGAATEFLTLRNGELGYLFNGTEHVTKTGDGSVRIEPGVAHTYWNAAPDTTLDFIATFSPPGNAEQFFRTVAGLGHDYGHYSKVPIPQWLVTFDANDMRMSWIPPLVWNTVVKRAAVPLAKFAGFRAFEDEYPLPQVA